MHSLIKYDLFKNNLLKVFFILIGSFFYLTSISLEKCLSNTIEKTSDVQNEPISAPKLTLNKNIYDFGVIKTLSTNKAVFRLTNTGGKSLIISDIKKCCGAVISLDKKELAPGENGILTAEYYTDLETGLFKKTIDITTNDPNNPRTTLTVTGKVIQTLKWKPESFKIASFGKDSNCPEIKITSLDSTKFSVKKFSSSCLFLAAAYDSNYTSTEILLKPKIDVDRIKELNINKGSVNIELAHPDYKTISLNFDIIPSLQSTPAQILVFNADVNEPVTKYIELQDNQFQNNANISTQIESIVSEAGTKVEIVQSMMVNKICKLDLKIITAKNKIEESVFKDQLVIKLKDGRSLNVPIRIFYTTQTMTSKTN
jgi:hypothetical protein